MKKRLKRLNEQNKQKMAAVNALPVVEKPSENGLTELLFVIDQSGSMSGQETEKAVVANFNKVIAQQREEPGDAIVSTILFNTHLTILCEAESIASVSKMYRKSYCSAGDTALLDAVGEGLTHICKRQTAMSEAECPGVTIVVIITDGEENSSRIYTRPIIKQMIQTLQEKHKWNFLYFGANVDHFAEAHNLGVDEDDSMSFETTEGGGLPDVCWSVVVEWKHFVS